MGRNALAWVPVTEKRYGAGVLKGNPAPMITHRNCQYWNGSSGSVGKVGPVLGRGKLPPPSGNRIAAQPPLATPRSPSDNAQIAETSG